MDSYEAKIQKRLALWEKRMLADIGIWENLSRKVQKKIDAKIPAKFHTSLGKALEYGIKSVLTGINLIPVNKAKLTQAKRKTLIDIDEEVDIIIKRYKKIATVTGAGTGAGGIFSLAIDYPSLISLELKMLQEIAQAFGHNLREYEERIYLLKVFMLAFSGDIIRKKTYIDIISWSSLSEEQKNNEHFINWQELYHEYKEKVEFKKTLQIIPGIGIAVGAWSNYGLIEELGETARNCYRLRKLAEPV